MKPFPLLLACIGVVAVEGPQVRAQAPIPLLSGEAVVGQVTLPGDGGLYSFAAARNDTVIARMTELDPAVDPRLELYDPVGNLLNVALAIGGSVAELSSPLAEAGTYQLLCRGAQGGTGRYTVSLIQLPGYPLGAGDGELGALGNGECRPGAIEPAGDLDAFTFSGQQGEVVQLRMGEIDAPVDPRIELYDPAGFFLQGAGGLNASLAEIVTALPGTGVFTVVCKGFRAGAGRYTASMLRVSAASPLDPSDPDFGRLNNGEVRLGAIGGPGDLDAAVFRAERLDQVLLRAGEVDAAVDPVIEVYAPNGSLVGTGGGPGAAMAEFRFQASATGDHFIVSKAFRAGVGGYALCMLRLPGRDLAGAETDCIPFGSGDVLDAALHAPGDLDLATFFALAGDTARVRMDRASGDLAPQLELFTPAGVSLGTAGTAGQSRATLQKALPATGVYSAVARGAGIGTGAYRLELELTGGTTPDDADGDRVPNDHELLAKTDPLNPASYFRVVEFDPRHAGGPFLKWRTVGGRRYRLQRSDTGAAGPFFDLVRPDAQELESNVPAGQPDWQSHVDSTPPAGAAPARFYRVIVFDSAP